jgi:hypothetical protein
LKVRTELTQTRELWPPNVVAMEEARSVLERLRRIDELKAVGAPADVLLGEVRALLGEAEAWIEAEGAPEAAPALESSREALAGERAETPA